MLVCWLSVVLCFSFVFRPVSFFLSNCLFLSSFSFLLQLVWCAGLLIFVFSPRVHGGWHCMAKSPCCVGNMYLCLVVCDHRTRLYEAADTACAGCRWVQILIIQYTNVVIVTSKWTFEKYFGSNTPPKKLRLPSSTRPPAASRYRHVPSAQQHYDVPAKERASVPHLGEGEAWKSPSRGRLVWPPAWRGVVNNCKSRPARER